MNSKVAINLPGLDGANPLAFLAALGVLRLLSIKNPHLKSKLAWDEALFPTLHLHQIITQNELLKLVQKGLRSIVDDGVAKFGDIIGIGMESYGEFIQESLDKANDAEARNRLLFASAYGSPAVSDEKKGTVVPSLLSFSNGQGGKLLLKDFRTLVSQVDSERLAAALFCPWRYEDEGKPTFRWDPNDMRMGAFMATDPGSTDTQSVLAANALAFVGMSFLTSFPAHNKLQTVAFRAINGEAHLVWPIWSPPLDADSVNALLQQRSWSPQLGIISCFASKRVMFKKNLYLAPSVAIED